MVNKVRKVNYCYISAPSRAGHGAKILGEIRNEGISMFGFSGFPTKGGKAQLDLVTNEIPKIRRLAKQNGWTISKTKKGFLVQGNDDIGAVHRQIKKLADKKINVTAADAVASGNGGYGMMLWVKPKDYARAARTLGAR